MLITSLAVAAAMATEPKDISKEIEQVRRQANIASLVCAAYKDGELVATGATGWLSHEHPIPVTINSVYHIGSCTKAMTAELVGLLVERGELTWDTSIADALPGVSDQVNEAFKELTVRDLLGHRAGIAESQNKGLSAMPWVLANAEKKLPLRGQRRAIAEGILRSGPQIVGGAEGTFAYSNFGYILAGVIIEEKFDKPWEEVMAEEIFEPLGMTSAGFGPPGVVGEVVEPLGHQMRDEWMPLPLVEGERLPDNPASFGPAGTVHANIIDWGKFVADFEQGLEGKGKLLKQETYEAIATDTDGDGYALGWGATERPWGAGTVYSHAGSNTYWYAVTWVAPETDLVVLAASNMPPNAASEACDQAVGMLIGEFNELPVAEDERAEGPAEDDAE
ncbi:MAG: beta-lactamase family protein [Phycisphaerales bacterium]|nr:beta-lactamase family protein [Phycisphaerales bacterium]MCB9836936.1 beta-lactamase family protein [Phycisphaera sp.]